MGLGLCMGLTDRLRLVLDYILQRVRVRARFGMRVGTEFTDDLS